MVGVSSEVLGGVLCLGAPDAESFHRLAAFLARVAADGSARIGARESAMAAVGERVDGSAPHWQGPKGDGFRQALRAKVGAEARVVEPPGGDGYRALAALAQTAREVGAAIGAVDRDHRNRVQAVIGTGDEWAQRAWTNVQDVVGLESDEEAALTRRLMDDANRSREEIGLQVDRWRRACETTAAALQRSTDHLAAALTVPAPAALARHPEATYREAAVKEDLQHRWILSVVEPRIQAATGDLAALRAIWERLAEHERRVLMERRPDLVATHLWSILSSIERRAFQAINHYPLREHATEVTTAVTVPIRVIEVRIGQVLKLGVTHNSDGSVDVMVSMDREAGIEVGLDDLFTAMGGSKGRVGVSVHFDTTDEYVRAKILLDQAVDHDVSHPEELFGRSWRVMADEFGAAHKSFQLAAGATSGLEAEFPEGLLPLRTGTARDAGSYYDGRENEAGVYVTNQVYTRVGPVDGRLEADGRVYLKDGDRAYARVTLTADGSVSAPLLERSGFTPIQLENMGVGEGTRGMVSITITTEATNGNRQHLIELLNGLATGRVQPEELKGLHAGSEVTIAVATGTAQREAVPTNPIVEAEVNVTDMSTRYSFRKTPNGDYYQQATP